MNFVLTEEQEQLRDASWRFFSAHGGQLAPRHLDETALGFDPQVWQEAGELGWTAIGIPEEDGGIGLGVAELAIIQEALGFSLYPLPLLASVGMAAPAIVAAAQTAEQRKLLGDIASGRIASLAATGTEGIRDCIDVTWTETSGVIRLNGSAGFVPFGAEAEILVVAARDARNGESISLFAVAPNHPGIAISRPVYMDITRPVARIEFSDVALQPDAALGPLGEGRAALDRACDIAAILLAAEQIGGARRCLEMSVDHAKQRIAFGRALGSFQAIKHMLADMAVLVETGRAVVRHAAKAADTALLAADPHALAQAASTAKSYCSDAFVSMRRRHDPDPWWDGLHLGT
jgi:alkylation response protein AidB-like acyl-CoA dehydrogenase